MNAIRKLIRVDGTEVELPEKITMREIAKLIGAQTLDFVSLRHLGEPLHVMAVDDAGHDVVPIVRPGRVVMQSIGHRRPINAKATALYHANCIQGTTHQIVGDVVIVPDEDFAEAS